MASGVQSGRSPREAECLRLRFDAFELDEADARLTRDGQSIAVAPKAFAVLCALARQPSLLMTKNALLDAVWGHQFVSESVLKTTISELRAALADDAKQPRYIETVARRGYRFIGAVSAPPANAVASPSPALGSAPLVQPVRLAPMTGRQAALGRLHAAWGRALAGQRQIVWIAGEAGVGKTTLIDHFVAKLGSVVCARGQCVEQHGAGEPYLPVLEALGELSRIDAALAPLLRAIAPTWLLQLPWLGSDSEREGLRRELAGTRQDRMLRELGELLDHTTRDRPLLLVTEDLHWSDHATVHLIDHIARRRGPARLMWVASFRLAEVIAEDHPLKALRHELSLHRLCDEILLDPFSERELADYVETRFPGVAVPEVFVHGLHAHTEGLPLFVVNVIDELVAQGATPAAFAAAPTASAQVPESLAGVIEKQIARLAPEQRALLEAASVVGVEFQPATVADALERDANWVEQACDELARRKQWLNALDVARLSDGSLDARYGFRHALYRRVFYHGLGTARRAQLHRRVARSLERSRAVGGPVTSAELASHYELSRSLPAALHHYADAADSALRHFAPVEAMALTAHALALLPQCQPGSDRDELELEVLRPRSVAASQLFGTTAAESTAAFERIDALSELLPDKTRRPLELELGWVFQARGEYDRARALAARKFDLAEQRGDRLLHLSACNLMGATLFFQGDLIGAQRWLEQGLAAFADMADELARVSFVMDPGVSLHARLGRTLSHMGLIDQARAHSDAALARVTMLGQPYGLTYARAQAGLLALRLGDAAAVLDHAESLGKTVADHAVVEGEAYVRWLRGWALAQTRRPDDGLALIIEGYESHRRLGRIGAGCAAVVGYAAEALILAGRWRDAQSRLAEALSLAHRIGERAYLPDLLLLQARIAGGLGDDAAAYESMRAALRQAREQQALWLELTALVALCERDGATRDDVKELKLAHARLSEGFDTALAGRIGRLLGARPRRT